MVPGSPLRYGRDDVQGKANLPAGRSGPQGRKGERPSAGQAAQAEVSGRKPASTVSGNRKPQAANDLPLWTAPPRHGT